MTESTEFRCRSCGGPLPVESESEYCLIAAEAFCPACERAFRDEQARRLAEPPSMEANPKSGAAHEREA